MSNVHEEVNVWIVYAPLVVIVPPVAVAVAVRYLTITTQLPPAHHTHTGDPPPSDAHQPPPHHVFVAPSFQLHDTEALPPPPAPPVHAVHLQK